MNYYYPHPLADVKLLWEGEGLVPQSFWGSVTLNEWRHLIISVCWSAVTLSIFYNYREVVSGDSECIFDLEFIVHVQGLPVNIYKQSNIFLFVSFKMCKISMTHFEFGTKLGQ